MLALHPLSPRITVEMSLQLMLNARASLPFTFHQQPPLICLLLLCPHPPLFLLTFPPPSPPGPRAIRRLHRGAALLPTLRRSRSRARLCRHFMAAHRRDGGRLQWGPSVFVRQRCSKAPSNFDGLRMYALLGANKGCLSADAALGFCLLMGFGAARDQDRGLRLIRESAAAFCAAGMCVGQRGRWLRLRRCLRR
jgi:hypothetical protein